MTQITPQEADIELEGITAMLGPLVVGLTHEQYTHPTPGAVTDARVRTAEERLIKNPVGSNCAERFQNTVFAIRDFCWCDGGLHPEDADGIPTCPPNFEHFASGITGEWYKRHGRDTLFSRQALPGEALGILMDCIRSLPNQDIVELTVPPAEIRSDWGWKVEQP